MLVGSLMPRASCFLHVRARTAYERFYAFVSGNLDLRRAAEMAVEVYGADVAPQVLGRVILALIGGVGVVSPENVT